MSRRTSGAQGSLATIAALTSIVVLWSWGSFVADRSQFVGPLLFGVLVVTLVGVGARAVRFPVVVVAAAQVLALMLLTNLIWGSSLLPTPESVRATLEAFSDAVTSAQHFKAPVPASAPSTGPLLVVGALLCHILVDLTAVTLSRVPVAGLPLLTVYSVPVSVLDRPVSWVIFVLGAIGFLAMLVQQEKDRVVRWGRTLEATGEASGFNVRTGHTPTAAVGATAITLALFVPLLIPTLELEVFETGDSGSGAGSDRQIRITNPITDLKRDLVESPDVPVVRVRTTNVDPSYLRLSVLTKFTGITWSPGGRDLPDGQEADGPIPPPTGLSSTVPRVEEPWNIAITDDLRSDWLPTPLRVTEILGAEGFRYDGETLDFTAHEDVDTAGMEYSLTALELDLTSEALDGAGAPPPSLKSSYTQLPSDFPEEVTELAKEVTAEQTTDFARADALQDYFRENYTYSTVPDPGNGNNELVDFLFGGDRRGYCEQFASAMAVMARSLGIPARVAVGFLDADPIRGQQDVWEFSSRDMHAWPEVYLDGFGWVMLEPTPQRRTGAVPSYTLDFGSSGNPTALPSNTRPTQQPTTAQPTTTEETAPEEESSSSDEDDSLSALPFLVGGVALLLLIALALLPRVLRRRRTANRWHSGYPAEAAWAELRDVTVDLGVPWPAGRSPRAGARLLAAQFAAPLSSETPDRPKKGPETNPEATAAVEELASALELARYAPPGAPPAELAVIQGYAETCAEALRAGVTRGARRRAEWWPRSVLSRKSGTAAQQATRARPVQGVVDSLG